MTRRRHILAVDGEATLCGRPKWGQPYRLADGRMARDSVADTKSLAAADCRRCIQAYEAALGRFGHRLWAGSDDEDWERPTKYGE